MRNIIRLIIVLLFSSFFFSCVPLKETIYLQGDLSKKLKDIDELYQPEKTDYLVKPNDILYIKVSSLDERTSAFLNPNSGFVQLPESATAMNLMGYRVDIDGSIDFPFIGKIFVSGLSLSKVQEKLHLAVSKYIDQSSVTVKLLNDNVTVLGEVTRPGRFPLAGEEINILEAISLAGETTDYSNKRKVRLIRRDGDSYQMVIVNTLDEKIMFSPYYYLRPGDIIYVEPRRLKSLVMSGQAFSYYLTILNTGLLIYTTYLAYYQIQNNTN
ncbi:MAG: polysaccharide export protein [Marinilabiliaceae bacterium]|nr:polysaccharide export protein [Marinilabiliaceae bacterium]